MLGNCEFELKSKSGHFGAIFGLGPKKSHKISKNGTLIKLIKVVQNDFEVCYKALTYS